MINLDFSKSSFVMVFLFFVITFHLQSKVVFTQNLPDTTLADEWFSKARVLGRETKYDSSIFYCQKAKAIYEKLGDRHGPPSLWAKALSCYNQIGNILTSHGKYEHAHESLYQGMQFGLEKLGENHVEVAKAYYYFGIYYATTGDLNQALENFQRALSIRVRLLGEDSIRAAECYLAIGVVYENKGDYDNALEYYKKSLSIGLRLLGEDSRLVASTYNNIGVVCLDKGEYDKALEYYKKSLSIKLRLLGEDHPRVANNYENIGLVYLNKGAYDSALEYCQKSLAIRLRLLGENHPKVGQSYNNIGLCYAEKGDDNRALEYYRKSLAIRLQQLGNEHPLISSSYNNIGNVYSRNRTYVRALKQFQKSLILLVSGFDEQDIYRNPPLEGISSERKLLETLKLKSEVLARLSEQSGKKALDMALATYKVAAELIDKMRTGYKAEGSKLFIEEKFVQMYEKAIETALKLYEITQDEIYKETAFLFAEKSKASILSQALRETQAKAFGGIPETVLAKERQLRIDLTLYNTQLQMERQKNESQDETKIEDFESRYFTLQTEYNGLIDEIEKNYPRYYDLKYQTKTASVSELQTGLDPQTTVVEYFLGERSIYLFTVAKGLFEITTVPKDTLFETQIERLRYGIEKDAGEGEYELYVTNAHKLYRLLIQPVQHYLKTKSLILIPDGAIAYLPFEALLTEEVSDTKSEDYLTLPYLLKRYDISYANSANLLLKLITQSPASPSKDYLAFAPIFLDSLVVGSRAAELVRANHEFDLSRTSYFATLPASRDEVLGIQKLFRENYSFFNRLIDWMFDKKTRVYLDNQADEETLKKEALKDYRYVHFATHGFANRNAPGLSGLVLAQDSTSSEDDVLFLQEIYNLELNADLVTLSACESGTGKLAKGEGLLSLSRGFLYAGAKNLLVSLWEAPDRLTCELMLAFYEEMLNGKSKAEALRKAKERLINGQYQTIDSQVRIPDYAKPFYWAPFILIGK